MAEDAVQEVFISLTRHEDAFRQVPEEKRRNYLIAMVRNQSYAMRRELQKQDMAAAACAEEESSSAEYFDVEHLVQVKERTEILFRCLGQLDEEKQELLLLRYYYHLSGREIAERMQLNQSTVWTRLHRAMKELGALVRKELGEDE